MSRRELIEFIYKHSKEEFICLKDVFELAKENKKQLKSRVENIINYLENEY